jgi:hypothetical protein
VEICFPVMATDYLVSSTLLTTRSAMTIEARILVNEMLIHDTYRQMIGFL